MTSSQRLPASLTSLDAALAALFDGVEPVAPIERALEDALCCIAAELPPLRASPPRNVAVVFIVRSNKAADQGGDRHEPADDHHADQAADREDRYRPD